MPKLSSILGQLVYRGVHREHPRLADAKNGAVYPGNLKGTVTPAQHNRDIDQSKDSPYTSWSTRIEVARKNAYNYGGGGVVLRTRVEDPPEPSGTNLQLTPHWHWVESPDIFEEDEVLLFGIRIDVEVIEP